MFIGSFRQIEQKAWERPKEVLLRPPFNVSWCCVTGFYRPELVESVNQSERTRGREPATALSVCFLNLKTMAGCRKKKILWTRSREENARSSLDISFFFCRGGEGRQNFPKQRLAWQKWRWLEVRSWRKESLALRVLLSGWHSPPQKLDDRSHQTWIVALWRVPVLSKLKKARKSEVCLAEEERQNFLAAA